MNQQQFHFSSVKFLSAVLVSATIWMFASGQAAHAVVINESEPNDTSVTADIAGGAEVTGITGNQATGDPDFFKFTFALPVQFQILNLGQPGAFNDPFIDIVTLELRQGDGTTVIANCGDCWYNNAGQVTVVIDEFLTAGMYFVYLNSVNNNTDDLGAYSFDINVTPFSDVPEPGTIALLCSGLTAVAMARRRKKAARPDHWPESPAKTGEPPALPCVNRMTAFG